MSTEVLNIRWLKQQEYSSCWQAMKDFTQQRDANTLDEIWMLEHPPVFTQGQNGKAEHLLNPGNIPVVQTDRGGQITYHGPGQLMVYTLIDLKRKHFNVRELVTHLEKSVIDLLNHYQVNAVAKPEAPGVYVADQKICSIGLRIRKGCSYHGIAFNIAMDLEPFTRINPCGFKSLQMTQMFSLTPVDNTERAGTELANFLMKNLVYTHANYLNGF